MEGHLALSIQESVRPTGGCRITKEVAEQLEGRKALRRVQRSQLGIELIRGHRVIRRYTSCNDSRGSRVARMAPAAKRVPNVWEEVFRVTMKAPSSQWGSKG